MQKEMTMIDPLLQDILTQSGAIVMEEFADALVGHSVGTTPRAIYDVEKMIGVLQDREKWTEEECWEWLEYNTFPTFHPNMSKNAPIFLYPFKN